MLIKSKHDGYQAGIRLYPGKGGGSSAPPPDPRLVQSQIDSNTAMTDYGKRMVTIAEDMAPLQKQQLQFGLDTSKTSWDQGQADRTYSLGKRAQLSTLQDQQIADSEGNNVGQRSDQFAKTALADVNSSFSNSFAQNNRGMSRMGGNPASGAAAAMQNQNALAQAAVSANSMNQVRAAARQEGFALNDRASNSLAGYPGMAMSATGAAQSYGTAGVGLTNASLSGQTAGYASAGNLMGQAGSNSASMYGAMGSYKNGADQIAASNNPTNALLGVAANVGMNYMMPGSSAMAGKKAFSWG